MSKYAIAYYDVTHHNISITTVRHECNKHPAIFERTYRGHLFCPGCRIVPLTLVHDDGILYFRGHPNTVHGDDCVFALDEHIARDISKLRGVEERQALAQRDALFRLTYANVLPNDVPDAAGNDANENNAQAAVHQHQEQRKRLPQCFIENLPYRLARHDYPEGVCVYYGVVGCSIMFDVVNERYKEEKANILILKGIDTGNNIMALTISKAVWNHLDAETKGALQSTTALVHLAFLAQVKNFRSPLIHVPFMCYLRSSNHITAQAEQ